MVNIMEKQDELFLMMTKIYNSLTEGMQRSIYKEQIDFISLFFQAFVVCQVFWYLRSLKLQCMDK